ncbi:hypothetical protein G9A89_001918 [Geosiphon pyriformis]|nr:hypothetical protein G9A89_001918 [Geosiphon pyriformis]
MSSWKWKEDKEKKEKETTQTTTLICVDCGKKLSSIGTCCENDEEYSTAARFYCHSCVLDCFRRPKRVRKWNNQPCLACGKTLLDEEMWNDIPERRGTCDISCQYTILISDWVRKRTPMEAAWRRAVQRLDSCPHNDDKIWRMELAKIEGAMPEEIKMIKDNPPVLLELDRDAEPIINLLDLEQFHEYYQKLAPTREEQEQWLEQLNTRLCQHCLIPCDFQYCNECDLIYNPPPRMIYMILEEEKPISSCASESELPINRDSNSDNDDNNNGSSSIQNGNDDENDSDSDSKPDLNYKQYIALSDLSKKQELKWYSNNGKGIMPERAHDMDAGFDLRYPRKDAIKLELHLCTCIDLKIALEISATTMVQLASKSSLAKKGINIRGGIIDAGYVRNIIAMLQNDSEKTYIIEPNEKIAQAIFLPLVRIAQLVSVRKREELGITARGIQGFGSTDRIDVPVNMAEEKTVGQEEIISTGEIELINLHIPAKSYSSIKIPIYNNTGNVINIPKGITIGYLTTEIEDQPPNSIPDFPQLCGYVDITSQTIYRRDECYLLQPEQLKQMNMENLDPLQCMQLKMLLNNFNNIFASENEFGRTNIIQHQIKTGNAMPIKQRAYRVPPASHEIIC